MVLYTADISKLAVPVKSVQQARKKEKEHVEVDQKEVELVPKKRKPTKKQLEKQALDEAVKQEAFEEGRKEQERKEQELKEAMEPPKKKRRVNKTEPEKLVAEEKKKPFGVPEPAQEITPEPSHSEEEKKPRKRKVPATVDISVKKVKDEEPPQWFHKYVENVKREEAALRTGKVPAKQIKQEAQEAANRSWNDGLTRDRVTSELDNHSKKMLISEQNVFPDFCKKIIVWFLNK